MLAKKLKIVDHPLVTFTAYSLLENFCIISFDVLRLNEVTKSDRNLWWGYSLVSILWLFTTNIKQKSATPNNKTALQQALLLAYSLCSFSFFALHWACWSTLAYNASGTSLKTKVTSMILPVNQHFKAHHTLTSKEQSLFTKPRLKLLKSELSH